MWRKRAADSGQRAAEVLSNGSAWRQEYNPGVPTRNGSHILAFSICVAGLVALFFWVQTWNLAATHVGGRWLLPDPDDYMRLYRVRMILDGQATVVRNIATLHSPRGTELHWTAPLDYLIVGATKACSMGGDAKARLMPVAAWLPVVLGAIYLGTAMALLYRALGPGVALIAGLMMAVSPGMAETFRLGHSDHHCLLELCMMLSLYCWLSPTGWRERDRAEPSAGAVMFSGVCIGLAIWVSVLAIVAWGAMLIGATYASFHASADRRAIWGQRRIQWGAAAQAVVAIGWVIENAPDLTRLSADKVSILHAAILALAMILPAGSARHRLGSARRWVFFGVAAAALAIWTARAYTDMTAVFHRAEFYRWSSVIAELQPLIFRGTNGWSIMPLLRYFGFLPFVLPIGLWLLRGDERISCMAKASFGLLATVMTGLAIAQLRWADHVMMAVGPVIALALTRVANQWLPERAAGRAGTVVLAAAILIFPGAAGVLTPPSGKPDPFMTRLVKAIDAINLRQQTAPLRSTTIMCEYDAGPILLFETGLPVVAGPYHRCIDGIVDVTRFFSERDDVAARAEMSRLGVGYVVVPYIPAHQLWMFEKIAYGELRSYAKAEWAIKDGEPYENIEMKPEIARTVAYRLTQCQGTEALGVKPLEKIDEGANTPDHLSGLVYVVEP